MLKSISWDIYTYIIIALVPGVLLAAWGLTAWDDHRVHQQQCAVAEEWLNESALIAPVFESAGTMDDIDMWITGLEEFNTPSAAGELRQGILSSANYRMENFPNENTTVAGVLNPRNGLFERVIVEGTEDLIEHCPDTESMLPDAFPMVFEKEDPN